MIFISKRKKRMKTVFHGGHLNTLLLLAIIMFIISLNYSTSLGIFVITTQDSIQDFASPCLFSMSDKNNWMKILGGMSDDSARAIIQTSDGGFAATGFTSSSSIDSKDTWLIKIASDGSVEWNRTYGGANSDFSEVIIQDEDDGFVLAGTSQHSGSFKPFSLSR